MNISVYHNRPAEFVKAANNFMMENETINTLVIGISNRLAETESNDIFGESYFWTVTEEDKISGVAMMTPPHDIVLVYPFTEQAITEFSTYLKKEGYHLPGVLGPKESAGLFSSEWSKITDEQFELFRSERLYRLDAVEPNVQVPGVMLRADNEQKTLLTNWVGGFMGDTGEKGDISVTTERYLKSEQLYLWEDKKPVSMAAWAGVTPNGVRITMVYTPDEFRRKGYATALVSSLSSLMLQRNASFCCLYTDLSNPISNSIYQKIGYRPVMDMSHYRFTRK
ncbi:MAG: GNAT family N-acetyltransferase [Dehalococcoidales bacterium]|nr:GNAT family N-acetyltransferase [Dehalococcoidales bacterium]